MAAVIEFDKAAFRTAYPEFASLADAVLTNFWNVACLISGLNGSAFPIANDTDGNAQRQTLLFMLICHLCELNRRGNAAVGAIASASEGSVSTSFASAPATASSWWYYQTRCGAAYWQAMMPFRIGGRYFGYKGY